MPSIFYDLETTDQKFTGQILNYCFSVVDDRFEIAESLFGTIRISRLQLPRAGAILANRTDVLKHQAEARDDEPEALAKIASFIAGVLEQAPGRVPFIGYNSSKFDLQYLRTSMIRNGINPYFGGRLIYRDLLHVAQKLAASHPRFPRQPKGQGDRASYSLEVLTKAFGLLEGEQTHHSLDDVALTVSLARHLCEEFELDVRTYDPFEVSRLNLRPRTGEPVYRIFPSYELSGPRFNAIPYLMLDADRSGSLWVDLERFEEGRGDQSLRWLNPNRDTFFLLSDPPADDVSERCAAALEQFREVSLQNYFTDVLCDVEQHIYQVGFAGLDALTAAIWNGDLTRLKKLPPRDPARILYSRFKLARYQPGGSGDGDFWKRLEQYALYRYGGKMSLNPRVSAESEGEGERPEDFHPTYSDLLSELDAELAEASEEDRVLLEHLRKFYAESDIIHIAGEALSELTVSRIATPA